MSLLASLKKKEKNESVKRLPTLIEVKQGDETIPFLALRFGTHHIEFNIQCDVPNTATSIDLFSLFLEQIGEELPEDGSWRGQDWEISNLCNDSFTLFAKERATPIFFWKKKKE